MKIASEKLADARILLLTHEPWYGHAAMQFDWTEVEWIDTIGVRIGKQHTIECVYNPAFIQAMTLPEVCAVIQHEIEHVVRYHCVRVGNRDPQLWNIAADMAVNGHRSNPRIGLRLNQTDRPAIPMEDQIVWIPSFWFACETAEKYYDMICELSHGPQGETWFQQIASNYRLDNHDMWSGGQNCVETAEGVIAEFSREATRKSQGCVPGHLRSILSGFAASKVSWQSVFRNFIRRQISTRRKITYSRRNRRRDEFGMPGKKRDVAKLHVSVVVDVSGSISRKDLESFFGEIEKIVCLAVIDVLQWDCKFQGFHSGYRKGDWNKIKLCGGGGTDMALPVHWLMENSPHTDCVVIFTDGWCNWPDSQRVPLVSVITTDRLAPERIRSIPIHV